MASSNFLDKTGLSHFYSKIKEMLQGKQDKLTAGTGITITDTNEISAKNRVFYGDCTTARNVAEKVVVCPDWVLKNGNIIVVRFALTNIASGTMYLNVNNTGKYPVGPITNPVEFWRKGGIIAFAFDEASSKYVMINVNLATTEYYGMTKLSNVINTSQQMAVTPYAVKQVRDLVYKKQDALTAGRNILIENNVISANVEMNLSTYAYDITEESVATNGYILRFTNSGMSMEYSGYDAWTLKVKKQRIIATDLSPVNPVVVNLYCELDVGNGTTYDIVLPALLKEFFENTMLISYDSFENGCLCEGMDGSTLVQYHRFSNSGSSLTVQERTKLI